MKTNAKMLANRIEGVLDSVQWQAILKSTASRMRLGDTASFELKEKLENGDLSFMFNYELGENGLLLSTYDGKLVRHEELQSESGEKVASRIERAFNAEGRFVFSLQEAINLLEGRSVFKSYYTMDGVEREGWFKAAKDAERKAFQVFFSGGQVILPAYDLKAVLQKLLVVDDGHQRREDLIRSLQCGDQQEVRLKNKIGEIDCFIEADPASKSVAVFDEKKQAMILEQFQAGEAVENKCRNHCRNKSMGLTNGW